MATPYRSLVGLFLVCLLGAQSRAELRLLTEDAPPMSFIQDGQLTGMSADIVEALFQWLGPLAVPKHWYTHETLLARGLQNVYGAAGSS
ncbi:hypothetical protein ACSX1C_17485 [Pseudomonas sp. MBLB4123]|uniref:hypothetical protein n=1 Tax=Pseudomonas sp. MBLB4123 TaxID=3451557 RepID=UPI003F751B0E